MSFLFKFKRTTHKVEAKWKGTNWKNITIYNERDKELILGVSKINKERQSTP